MLEMLGIRDGAAHGESVAILVGPNGAGKSNFLKALALDLRGDRNLAVVCNTAYDRFAGIRGIKRISASRSGRSPKGVVKQAVARSLGEEDGRFYQVGKILQYCRYQPRFGFRVEGVRKHLFDFDAEEEIDPADGIAALEFLQRYDPGEIVWIDPGSGVFSFSLAREFASVLRVEDRLRRHGLLRAIHVYLERADGEVIELLHASSGELALISTLVFLITTIEPEPVILIDEPENSLHPQWQREYVDKILNAVEYRNATIIIATHAPLIVTGALTQFPHLVSVHQIREGTVEELELSEASRSGGSIEAILWRAFDVITPQSHYVSEELAGVVTRLEQGEIRRESALAVVNEMDEQSFDGQQRDFFGAVRQLIDKVDAERRASAAPDG
jgi:predicted ATPase